MTLEYKPDAQEAIERMEAWWNREVLDRPAIQVVAPQPNPRPYPSRLHATLRERWMDVEYHVVCAEVRCASS